MTREAGIGAYVGVPLRFSDGHLYGTLCALSHSPDPSLGERDARFMRALLAAIEARDSYVGDHSRFVAALATEVAQLMGLPEEEVAVVRQAAFLHDVGKVAIPDTILKKRGLPDDA